MNGEWMLCDINNVVRMNTMKIKREGKNKS
jgi:hypothetical protein